jgi:hypothetical protein
MVGTFLSLLALALFRFEPQTGEEATVS